MTIRATMVTVEIPARILELIAAAGQGCGRGFVRAFERESERRQWPAA